MRGFFEFLRERVVVGFAVGFIMGGAVGKLVSSLVSDIINPVLGLLLSKTKSLESMYFQISGARIMWGSFLSSVIDFIIMAVVVYILVKAVNMVKVEKKK